MNAVLAVLPLLAASTWTLVCGGDIMLNGISARTNPLAALTPLVSKADLAYANLEVPLTSATVHTARKTDAQLARKSQFVLRAEPGHSKHIASVGFDIVSLGNNHAMDFRAAGLAQMMGLLEKAQIAYAGAGKNFAAAHKVSVQQVKSLRVGLISFMSFVDDYSNWATTPATKGEPGIAALAFGGKMDTEKQGQIKRFVRDARKNCDVLLVAMHWGVERTTVPTKYQVSLGRGFIDAGADAVIGAHPHRLQGAEVYKGKPILYSLGNLISPLSGETGLVRLKFDEAKFLSAEFFPARIGGGKTVPYKTPQSERQLEKFRELCRQVQKKFPNPRSRSPFEEGA